MHDGSTSNGHGDDQARTLALAEELAARVEEARSAIVAATSTAGELFSHLEDASSPRFDTGIYYEAMGILGDLDGSSGSMFSIDRIDRDARDLVALIRFGLAHAGRSEERGETDG